MVRDMIIKLAIKADEASLKPVESAIDAINEAVRFLSSKLADRNSDLVRGIFSDNTSTGSVTLPADFNGFFNKPVINKTELEPLPVDYDFTDTTTGTPAYYEVIGGTLNIYPLPSSTVTVYTRYWVMPDTLIESDDIPFNGRFDSLLQTMAIKLSVDGFGVLSEDAFLAEVERGMDIVLFPLRPAIPARRPHYNF